LFPSPQNILLPIFDKKRVDPVPAGISMDRGIKTSQLEPSKKVLKKPAQAGLSTLAYPEEFVDWSLNPN